MRKNYFKLEEFLSSTTATKKGIHNIPSFEVIDNINILLPVLNAIREKWSTGIKITSGFRCAELNRAVGGQSTSAHLVGRAVDIVPLNAKIDQLYEFLVKYMADNNIKYDELIIERSGASKWVHFALYSINGEQRMKKISINIS